MRTKRLYISTHANEAFVNSDTVIQDQVLSSPTSKPIHAGPDPPLHRQSHQILPNADIHEADPHALINDIATLQPLPQPLLARPGAHFDFLHARLLDHEELSDLDEVLRRDARLDDLACLLEARFQRVDDDDAAFVRVPVVVVFVVWGDGVAEDVRVDLAHVRPVAADRAYVSAFFSAFGAGEVFGWEESGGAGRAAEDGVGFADVFLQ